MKNLKFFPFERNRYFYGKFLSVDDFDTEQRYMNDKRRLLNRFLHGCGVVCGLQVVEVDDFTISLEAGLALDFSGREIVVASPVTKRLSSITGYSRYEEMEEERQELYLCIAYEEQSVEPVHNLTGASGEQEEYNKYAEGYRLFVTGEEPEQEGYQSVSLYEETRTIFYGEGIRIRQTVPRYIQSGEEAELIVCVEKREQADLISFQYELRLHYLEQQGNSRISVHFDESRFAAADTYVLRFRLRAQTVKETEGGVEVAPDSFILTIGQDNKKEKISGKFKVWITGGSVEETVLNRYYQTAMEDILKDSYNQAVYLAKMDVIRAGDTYVIEKLENLPYQQRVWNGMLSESLETLRLAKRALPSVKSAPEAGGAPAPSFPVPETAKLQKPLKNVPETEKLQALTPSAPAAQISTGSVVIDLGLGGVAGKCFYSQEIVHGLGLGSVFISLGLARGVKEGNQVIYGSPNIFGENSAPNIVMAAKANPERGSFVIGIKCVDFVEAKKVRVCWMAVKDGQQKENQSRQMALRPDIVEIKVMESCFFEAVVGDEVQRHVKWSVKESEGGNVDAGGCYTAPNHSGVYEIIAESMENERLRAVAYVIVRDASA